MAFIFTMLLYLAVARRRTGSASHPRLVEKFMLATSYTHQEEFQKISFEMFWEHRRGILWLEQKEGQSGFGFYCH